MSVVRDIETLMRCEAGDVTYPPRAHGTRLAAVERVQVGRPC